MSKLDLSWVKEEVEEEKQLIRKYCEPGCEGGYPAHFFVIGTNTEPTMSDSFAAGLERQIIVIARCDGNGEPSLEIEDYEEFLETLRDEEEIREADESG